MYMGLILFKGGKIILCGIFFFFFQSVNQGHSPMSEYVLINSMSFVEWTKVLSEGRCVTLYKFLFCLPKEKIKN